MRSWHRSASGSAGPGKAVIIRAATSFAALDEARITTREQALSEVSIEGASWIFRLLGCRSDFDGL
jgi:hypothetical protein